MAVDETCVGEGAGVQRVVCVKWLWAGTGGSSHVRRLLRRCTRVYHVAPLNAWLSSGKLQDELKVSKDMIVAILLDLPLPEIRSLFNDDVCL